MALLGLLDLSELQFPKQAKPVSMAVYLSWPLPEQDQLTAPLPLSQQKRVCQPKSVRMLQFCYKKNLIVQRHSLERAPQHVACWHHDAYWHLLWHPPGREPRADRAAVLQSDVSLGQCFAPCFSLPHPSAWQQPELSRRLTRTFPPSQGNELAARGEGSKGEVVGAGK